MVFSARPVWRKCIETRPTTAAGIRASGQRTNVRFPPFAAPQTEPQRRGILCRRIGPNRSSLTHVTKSLDRAKIRTKNRRDLSCLNLAIWQCGSAAAIARNRQNKAHNPIGCRDTDEDGVGGDDAADYLRHLVATKLRVISQRRLRGTRLWTRAIPNGIERLAA